MVAAISTASRTSSHLPKTPSTPPHHRPPLSPSDKSHNNANNANSNGNSSIPKKPRSKPISSRYLPSSSSQSQYPTPSKPISSSSITTRTLSVSFQGPSFSLQTTKPKPTSHQKPKITRHPISLTKSVDFSSEKKAPILAAVRVVGHSVLFDEKPKRANFNGEDLYLASDSDSGSSSSNADVPLKRGISVPARFWPENFGPAKKSVNLMDTQLMPSLSPRSGSLIRPNPPGTGVTTGSSVKRAVPKVQGKIIAPSVLSLAAEARKVKKGESRIEEAHLLRMLHNRHLQWRFMNAQANAAIFSDTVNAENDLYNAWVAISELHDSVTQKRIKLQVLLQKFRIASILKEQMAYMEEWSRMDVEHYHYLSGLIEALKASTIRLPLLRGARVDIQKLQNAVGSAVDVMQAIGTSVFSLLSKAEGTSTLVTELVKAAAHEQALLAQSKDLLSTVAALHVKQCSLQGQIQQLNRKPNSGQVFK